MKTHQIKTHQTKTHPTRTHRSKTYQMYRYMTYMTAQKETCLLLFILLILSSAGGSLFSLVMSSLVDCAGKSPEELCRTLIGSAVFIIVTVSLDLLYEYTKTRLLTDARYRLKRDLFAGIMRRSVSDFDTGSSAEYINELGNNVNLLESVYFGNLIRLLESLVSFCSAALICILIQPVMLVLMILLALAARAVSSLTSGPLEKSMKRQVEHTEAYTAEIKDDFGAFRVIRSYGVLPFILQKHDRRNRDAETARRQNSNCRTLCAEAGAFVGLLSTVLVMGFAAYFSLKGMFSAGLVIAFGHLIGHIVSPITQIPAIIADFRSSRPLLERFSLLLEQKDRDGSMDLPDFRQAISLENLSFRYGEDRSILNNLSFRFEAGRHYLVTGSSGSGKTTLLSLLAGYYPDYDGSIFIDGVELRQIRRDSLCALIGIVSQDTFLFQDTIRNNISLYDESYETAEIEDAIEQAGLKKLIDSLPEGLSTVIGESGKNFSGGERQRLSLARALLRKSRILLLDEFTANLDAETAIKIEEALLERTDCMTITVTHHLRPGTLSRYDGRLSMERC